MPAPRLTLHIGQTKTGSTTLQRFCHLNRDWLGERGVSYPETPPGTGPASKHHHLLEEVRARRRGVGAPGWQALHRQAEDGRRWLVSDELFWHLHGRRANRRPAAIEWIARQLRGFDVRILCYLRRQDRWVESWFCQLAKGGAARMAALPLEAFVQRQIESGLLDYAAVLADWAAAFGDERLLVRAFEPAQLAGGDVLVDLAEQLGLRDLEGAVRPADSQVALSRPATLLINEINQDGADDVARKRWHLALAPREGEAPDPRRLLSPALAARLLAISQPGNEEVARRYRGGVALFQDLQVHGEACHYPALTTEDRVALSARLAACAPVQQPSAGPAWRIGKDTPHGSGGKLALR